MLLKKILLLLCLSTIVPLTSALSVHFHNEEEMLESTRSGPKNSVIIDYYYRGQEIKTTGSGMLYRFQGKILGITAAHIFNRAFFEEIQDSDVRVTLNSGYICDSKLLLASSEVSHLLLNSDYTPEANAFEAREPQRVRNDIALFSLPILSEDLYKELPELLVPLAPANGSIPVTAYSAGRIYTGDLQVIDKGRTFHTSYGTIYYDTEQKIFKVDHYAAQDLVIEINHVTHHINFTGLKNKPHTLQHLWQDSGGNVIHKTSGETFGIFTHTDYLPFFEKNSPLAQFFGNILAQSPSPQRTAFFHQIIPQHANIIREKTGEESTIYIYKLKNEKVDFTTQITPVFLHKEFINDYIRRLPKPGVVKTEDYIKQLYEIGSRTKP